jgi:hypothetical protein
VGVSPKKKRRRWLGEKKGGDCEEAGSYITSGYVHMYRWSTVNTPKKEKEN